MDEEEKGDEEKASFGQEDRVPEEGTRVKKKAVRKEEVGDEKWRGNEIECTKNEGDKQYGICICRSHARFGYRTDGSNSIIPPDRRSRARYVTPDMSLDVSLLDLPRSLSGTAVLIPPE